MKFLNKLMGSIGGFIVGAMMLLTVAEVLSRLFLKSSIEGSIELGCVFFALAVFFGFSPCEEKNAHVKVELITANLPEKVSFPLEIVVYLLAIIIVSFTSWQVGLDALSAWEIGEVLPGAKVQVPVYPAKIGAFIGYMAFCLQLVVNLISKLKLFIRYIRNSYAKPITLS
jgi:TRAP-type C4-dicarboxylate transport system permease small subunit